MDLGLEYRVKPSLDEREADRTSEAFASRLEDQIHDLDPTGVTETLFDTDDMFDDLEEMQDMAGDMSSTFNMGNLQSEGFAGDVLFGDGAADIGGDDGEGFIESFSSDAADFILDRDTNQGRVGSGVESRDLLEGFGESLQKNAQASAKSTALLSGLGRALKVGGAAVGIVGVGLATLKGIFGAVQGLADASPLLEQVLSMFSLAMNLFFRPVASTIGQLLLPIAVSLLQLAADFNQAFAEGGLFDAVRLLISEFVDAIFSLEGIFVAVITGLAGLLGTKIGVKAGALVGAKVGAVIGSIIPGAGTAAGGIIGAGIGAALGLLASTIIAFNVDFDEMLGGVLEFLEGIENWLFGVFGDIADIANFISTFLLGFVILGIEFFNDGIEFLRGIYNSFQEFVSDPIGFATDLFEDVEVPEYLEMMIDDILEMFPGWGEIRDIPSRVYSWVTERFPGWSDLQDLASDVREFAEDNFPGWSDLDDLSSDVRNFVEDRFPGWGNLPALGSSIQDRVVGMFDGWGEYIPEIDWNLSGFEWGSFIPTIDFDLPSFPGWGSVVKGTADRVGDAFQSFQDNVVGADPNDTQTMSANTGGSILSGVGNAISSNPFGTPGPGVGLASGGIVTDSITAMIGEGSESEAVMPLSSLQSFVDSSRDVNVSSNNSVGIESNDIADAVESGFENAQDDSDSDDMIRELKRVKREIVRMRSDLDMEINLNDESKWEVRK